MLEIVKERNKEYNNAWLVAGKIMLEYGVGKSNLFTSTPYAHNWTIILSKLIRALNSPNNKDHWIDIIGYCQLVLSHLEDSNEGDN